MSALLLFVAVGGFSLGVVTGVVFREAFDIAVAIRTRRKGMEQENPSHPRRARFLDNILLIALFAVVILQAGVGLALLTTRSDLGQVVQCQASYNQKFSEAYRARVDAANNSREKLNRVFFVVFDAQTAAKSEQQQNAEEYREEFRKALTIYVRAEKNYQQEREDHPLPPLPNTYCDRF